MTQPLNLGALVLAVRSELDELDAQMRQAEMSSLFDLDQMELELQFTVAQDVKTGAKLDLKIISFGGDDTVKNSQVQKIKLTYRVAETARRMRVPGTRGHSTASEGGSEDVQPLEG